MKLVIPSECRIGPLTYKIRWNDKLCGAAGLVAQLSPKGEIIRLTHEHSSIRVFISLVHEAMHSVRRSSGIPEVDKEEEEREVIAISNGVTDFLLSLGIEPDFSQIPEEEE